MKSFLKLILWKSSILFKNQEVFEKKKNLEQ